VADRAYVLDRGQVVLSGASLNLRKDPGLLSYLAS
jgi:ABC-type branched-subunit amino acid transport system ATPase component